MVVNYSATLLLASLLIISSHHLICCQPPETFVTNSSISWINSPSYVVNSTDGATLTPILSREGNETQFVCGFLCDNNGTACVFGVLIFPNSNYYSYLYYARLVWSANRNNPVRANATLQLRQDGGLFLMDSDGTFIWSTSTSGKVVAGFNLTVMGNLVLFDKSNDTIWQSFDNPTDSLVPGQKMTPGQKLISSISATDWNEGMFTLDVTSSGIFAYFESKPRQLYMDEPFQLTQPSFYSKLNVFGGILFVEFEFSNARFMRFGADGHLRVYHWTGSWSEEADILTDYIGKCGYPTACGNYSVCGNGQCSCPQTAVGQTNFLQQINYRQPNQECVLVTPISCEHSQYHILMELKDIAYFSLYLQYGTNKTDLENCKRSCLRNCSCKAAQFQFSGPGITMGDCALLNDVFSLRDNYGALNDGASNKTTLFIKVQNSSNIQASPSLVSSEKKSKRVPTIVGSTIGASFGLLFLVLTCFAFLFRRRKGLEEDEEGFLDQIPGMPSRFSYQELTEMTENFGEKLGEGGFGSVFEGTMSDGTKIAVKRLQGFGNVKKSFLAEVATIGSIQHVNLVRLVGFCAEKSHRLLVYEYMANGSLDRWIFHGKQEQSLRWDVRKKIISDVAKGLAYLHEDCNNKIIHLDIKPQNILLDQNLNAKVSDFGLSKLVGKDESKIVTTMRGTPGYLAPEWLNSVITEKVDVYSFGIVILEIICGRKNLDRLQDEDDMHLLSLFMRKAVETQLLEMVDKNSEDMQLHRKEAVDMMKIAAWCLQSDYTKRPSMSLVVKVLQGLVAAETDLDYSFTFPTMTRRVAGTNQEREAVVGISLPLPSQLSGPR